MYDPAANNPANLPFASNNASNITYNPINPLNSNYKLINPPNSSYNQQPSVPTKRLLTTYTNDENKYPTVKRVKDQNEKEADSDEEEGINELSESESETRSSSQTSNQENSTETTLSKPLAHSTPVFPAQPNLPTNCWGNGSQSTASQFQLASYLHNSTSGSYTQAGYCVASTKGMVLGDRAQPFPNYYANQLANQQQMMANYATYSNYQLNTLNPTHITPASHHSPYTNSFLPSGSNTQHNPAFSNALNFSNLACGFELTTNPESGCNFLLSKGSLRVDRQPQHNSSGSSAHSSGNGSSSGAGTDESYNSEPVEHKNVLALTSYNQLCAEQHSQQLAGGNLLFDTNLPYCEVSGRLALLSNAKRYKVTLSEIYRRISPPECLNASFLGGILRKAKNKNGGNELRNTLKRYNMSLPSGRRKSHPCTTFTSLCEDEAKQMGYDYFSLCRDLFPSAALATMSLKPVMCPEESSRRLNSVQWTVQIVHDLIVTVQGFEQSSLQPDAPAQTSKVESSAKDGIIKFSRLTHGFGNAAMITALQAFQEFLNCYSAQLGKPNMQKTTFVCTPTTSSHAYSLPDHQ